MTIPKIIDDKSPHCIPFILRHLEHHRTLHPSTPLIIALNGIQGSGKTTLVSTLSSTLSRTHQTLVFSIDDFYIPHTSQVLLAKEHADNPLLQHRGEPGTHDVELLKEVFEKLKNGKECRIPKYDKSAFEGQGDRAGEDTWTTVNQPNSPPIEVVIFEGWCVGFRPLPPSTIITLHTDPNPSTRTIQYHSLKNLLFTNEELREYDAITDSFDVFIHIDAEDLGWVYEWREEQEEALRKEGRGGMSREEVVRFVDGYFPAYEMFTEGVRKGVFLVEGKEGEKMKGRQLRLVVGRDRRVKRVIEI